MYEIQNVTDIDVVFGTKALDLMPTYNKIPDEFKNGDTKWNKVVNTWFYRGLKNAQFTPKDGVDKNKALKHIKAIMGSFEPKHEHKEAGCAYLLSEWFEDISYKED